MTLSIIVISVGTMAALLGMLHGRRGGRQRSRRRDGGDAIAVATDVSPGSDDCSGDGTCDGGGGGGGD